MKRTESLGPANDSEMTSLHYPPPDDNEGGFDWDISRPLAEQWPWNAVVALWMTGGDE